ncbi:hypothetical protein TRFO_39763 [Tritrichomonas foetus]|uniref:HECT-type E3 ubiquitin transferase n=1 Tax=Tritrichomonas foetus TaxID=1144522 RepID=A0A1J4J788_9EUKA|nr:hypothetical protein TRFO_39763 [Tritrichomonas foetus]|eukprot:OHS94055.1 hypothetical protein TRFO_39763 [Tritrichomonas foetus]
MQISMDDKTSLLFSNSKIFDDFTLEDCIIQSRIDIYSQSSTFDEAKKVFNSGLKILISEKNEKFKEKYQLFSLLIALHQKYHDLAKHLIEMMADKNMIHPNLLILAFAFRKGSKYAEFIKSQLLPQFLTLFDDKNSNQNKFLFDQNRFSLDSKNHEDNELNVMFTFNGYEISKATALFLVVNSINLTKLKKDVIEKYFRFLIKKEYPFSIVLLQKVQKENMIEYIPDSLFEEIFEIDENFSVLDSFLFRFPKNLLLKLFDRLLPKFFEFVSNNQNNPKTNKIARTLIMKINEFEMFDKAKEVSKLLEFVQQNEIDSRIFTKIKNLEIGPIFQTRFTNYSINPINFIKVHPDPCSIIPPPEFLSIIMPIISNNSKFHHLRNVDNNQTTINQVNKFDIEKNDELNIVDINKAFESFFKGSPVCEQLCSTDFWSNFLKIEGLENAQISLAANVFSANFKNNTTNFLDVLFQLLFQFSKDSCNLCMLVKFLWNNDENPVRKFFQDSRINALINYVNESNYNIYFWKIFPNIRTLISCSNNSYGNSLDSSSPIRYSNNSMFVIGMSSIVFDTRCGIPDLTIVINEQNKESEVYLKKFLSLKLDDFDAILEYILASKFQDNLYNEDACTLISAAILFAATYSKSECNIAYENLSSNSLVFFLIVLKILESRNEMTMVTIKNLYNCKFFENQAYESLFAIRFPIDEFKMFILMKYFQFLTRFSRIFLSFEGMAEIIFSLISPFIEFASKCSSGSQTEREFIVSLLQLILVFPQRTNNSIVLTCIDSAMTLLIPLFLKYATVLNNSNNENFKLHCQLLKFNKIQIINYFNDHFPACDLNYATFSTKMCPIDHLLNLFPDVSHLAIELKTALNEMNIRNVKVLINFFHYSNNDRILLDFIEDENFTKLDLYYKFLIFLSKPYQEKIFNLVFDNILKQTNISIFQQNSSKRQIIKLIVELLTGYNERVNFYRNLIETQIKADFVTTCGTFLSYLSSEFNCYPNQVCDAILDLYTTPNDLLSHDTNNEYSGRVFIKRARPIQQRNISELTIQAMNDFLQNDYSGISLEILCNIANILPFIFDNFDPLALLTYSFLKFNEKCHRCTNNSQNDSVNEHILHEKLNETLGEKTCKKCNERRILAACFLLFVASSSKFLDFTLPYIMENIVDFEYNEIFLCTFLIHSLLVTETHQFVMVSLLIKYNWNSIVSQIFQNNLNNFDHQNEIKLIKHLLEVTNIFVSILNRIDDTQAVLLDELQQSETPFFETFNFYPIIDTCVVKYYFTDLDNEFIVNQRVELKQKNIEFDFKQFLSIIHKKLALHENTKENELNQNELHHLPQFYQSIIMMNKLNSTFPNSLKHLNSAQRRILMHKPLWASQLLENSELLEQNLLMPEHYIILNEIIEEIKEVSNEDLTKEDVTLLMFCQSDLLSQIMDIYLTSRSSLNDQNITQNDLEEKNELFNTSFNLIIGFSKNLTSFLAIAELMNQKLCEMTNTVKFFPLILEMSKNDEFINAFTSLKNSISLIIMQLFETGQFSEVVSILEIFNKLENFIPDSIIQYYILLLFEPKVKKSLLVKIFKLCSKLPKNKFVNIVEPYIELKFSTFLAKYSKKNSEMLNIYLSEFPFLIETQKSNLLKLLKNLLSHFSNDNLSTIAVLFDLLCPKRTNTLSLYELDSDSTDDFLASDNSSSTSNHSNKHHSKNKNKNKKSRNDNDSQILKIPSVLINMNPEFWSIVNDNIKLLTKLIHDHIFKELKFLTNYPEVLQFQPRIDLFKRIQSQKIKTGSSFHLQIRRDYLLADSFRKLHSISTENWLKKFRINYMNERGVDAGGLRRDWFTVLIQNLFNPNYALFVPSSNGRSYQPSPSSYVNPDHIEYFTFSGKIIARALIEGVSVDAHLTRSFLKQILGLQMSLSDIEDADESLYQSFKWILNNDVTQDLDLYFTADFDDMGNHKIQNLIENGDQVLVNNENKEDFIKKMIDHRLVSQISLQTKAFLSGFYSLIPFEEIRMFKPDELDLLICGIPQIDISDLQKNCHFSGNYNHNHKVVKMFFNVLSKWNRENLAKFLLFVTGSSQVPIGGFHSLVEMGRPITINYGGDSRRFPVAHTCTNTLDLPAYSNEKELERKLLYSINECNSFGIA